MSVTTMNKAAKSKFASCLAGVACLASACAYTPVEEVPLANRPDARPVRNLTSFSESLRCMDRLFANFGVRNIVVTSQGIPDATGEIETGTKEMLISAISRMSTTSKAFTFVDFDQSQFDVNALQNLVGFTDNFVVPNYYIRGAITQLDQGVIAESLGAGASISNSVLTADVGASVDQVISMIAVDTNIGDLITRQILTGTSASNSIAVRRNGFGIDGGGALENPALGLNLTINFNRSEGVHQSVRTLVELSAIESLGKLTQVPYWRCLGIEQTNKAVEAQARDWFAGMSRREQITFAQRALAGEGLYGGPIDGNLDPLTKDAVGAYQSASGLIADGRIDADLYLALISGDLALGQEPKGNAVPAVYQPPAIAAPSALSVSLTTPRGSVPVYPVGEPVELQLRTSQDAFVYCYYQDANKSIARIFPNRFEPNALVAANQLRQLPGPAAPFVIAPEVPGSREEFLCVASNEELGMRLPEPLLVDDLTPMPLSDLGAVIEAFRGLSASPVRITRLPVQVAG